MSIIVQNKPVSPGKRWHVSILYKKIFPGKPVKSLICYKKKNTGRNNYGKITSRHMGGGHKKKFRIIDWKRYYNDGVSARVKYIEFDPNRSANIALIIYNNGDKKYIISPKFLSQKSIIQSGHIAPIATGNNLCLKNIPTGSMVHCIEFIPSNGAKMIRSAGTSAQLLALDNKYATLRLCSGETRKILSKCRASIGIVGNNLHNLQKIGKAGRNRWLGNRPRVRGVAMNPVDHPMGGGEGKTSGGRATCSLWGKPEGIKTRNKNKSSSVLIIRNRKHK